MDWNDEKGLDFAAVATPTDLLGTPKITFAKPMRMEPGKVYRLKLDTEKCIARLYERDTDTLVNETTYTRK